LIIPALAAASVLAVSGCNYSTDERLVLPGETSTGGQASSADPGPGETAATAPGGERSEEKVAILDNVVKLIQTSALNPGGKSFGNAIKNLNQFFEGTEASQYALDPKAREFLRKQLPQNKLDELEQKTWAMADARHVEDCMLYQGITARVSGKGDDLSRVRRVFDWMVEQIQLVPAGSLAAPGLGQAYARPYDVLLRGMATEGDGGWSERGWLFLSLCRQLGLDAGLVAYTPGGAKEPVVWCVAVLVDGKPYLFDVRLGLPIPDARGDGVATLEEAMTDPVVLDRMNLHLPDQPPYPTRAELLASPTKIAILLDSSPRYFSPRLKLLQQSLSGKHLTILYRDPAEQRDRFVEALGDRLGAVSLWELPVTVETLLFTNPQFVESSKAALMLFRPELPLLYARMKQLRGEIPEAVNDYVALRLKEDAKMTDQKTPIPREIQQALDVFATYFLGMCHLEQKDAKLASRFFTRTLELLPEPGPRRPYFYMFRWGAQSNLGRLAEAKGDRATATAYYSQKDPTTQRYGNLLRARDLVWRDPTAPCPDPLPPAPPDDSAPETVSTAK
jgi:hypothetical protein